MPTVLVTAGKIEENPPRHGLAPRRVRARESAEKGMYISRQVNQKPVSSTALDILQKNVRYWGTLELSMLRLGLPGTTGAAPYPGSF